MAYEGLLFKTRGSKSAGTSCPICGSSDGRCKEGSPVQSERFEDGREVTIALNSALCMTESSGGNVPGWKFIKEVVGQGVWGYWLEEDDRHSKRQYTPEEKRAWAIAKREQEQRFKNECAESLSADERDRHYRSLLAELALDQDAIADLTRRGLSQEEIASSPFRSVKQPLYLSREYPTSLPGIDAGSPRRLACASGYLCPITDVSGRIVGAQVRVVDAIDNKYRWLSSPQANPRQQNSEFPLAIHRPPVVNDPFVVGLVEGVGPKPFITSLRRSHTVIGSAGGQFSESPETLKHSLETLNARQVVLYPDKGSISNPGILAAYTKVLALVQSWDMPAVVAWWGQVDSSFPDADELNGEDVQLLSADKFLKTASALAIASYLSLSFGSPRDPGFDLCAASTSDILRHNKKLRANLHTTRLKAKCKQVMWQKKIDWADVAHLINGADPFTLKGFQYQEIIECVTNANP